MSHWVYLYINGEIAEVPNQSEGGTYVVGGIPRAELNGFW